jgi:cyanophycinase
MSPVATFAQSASTAGSLVIVGGALSRDNEVVHRAFISRAVGNRTARFAIIPSASGGPAGAADSFKKTLIRYGVPANRIDVVHLATQDDRDTPNVDESRWANANNPAEIAKINAAGAIWFTGGDQARTIRLLLAPQTGADTPMLTAIRQRLINGAVIGGSSAGAAIMSPTMIARGDSLQALLQPALASAEDSDMDGGPLVMAPGLGFFPGSLVDQHFDRKARLGRLAHALALLPTPSRIGFGIDEDTALVIDFKTNEATSVGAGGVSVIDARTAIARETSGRFGVTGMSLSYFGGGDGLNLTTLAVTPATYKKPTLGREYYDHPAMNGGGMAVPNNRVDEALGVDLLDNKVVTSINRTSFDGSGKGIVYRFTETPQSQGWFGNDDAGKGRYTISKVQFDIDPVDISILPAGVR